MRRLISLVALALPLLFSLGALADDPGKAASNDRSDSSREKRSDKTETIRGTIAGVTILGEMEVNNATHQAQAAEASYITVVGWPAHHGSGEHAAHNRDKDVKTTSANSGDKSEANRKERHRANVYVIALTPNTKVSESQDAKSSTASEIPFEAIEVGDRVEVTFQCRDLDKNQAAQKHGRHRTFYGMANSIKVLPEVHDRSTGGRSESSDKSNK